MAGKACEQIRKAARGRLSFFVADGSASKGENQMQKNFSGFCVEGGKVQKRKTCDTELNRR